MATGKKLMILTCYAFAATALLLVCLGATAVHHLASSGKPLCVPRLSIRCHQSDCGSFFQRCGNNELLEVPERKVCYQGALLSASRTDLHSCPSIAERIPRNSSKPQEKGSLRACDCSLCDYPKNCQCRCTSGVDVEAPVTCQNSRYSSLAVAMSMGIPEGHCSQHGSEAPRHPMWEFAWRTAQRHYFEVFAGHVQWSLQDLAASFTFQPPLTTDSNDFCPCSISADCLRKCQG